MLPDIDHGTRCDRHVGEAFRVRCSDCDDLARQKANAAALPPYTLLECPLHPGYFHYPTVLCDRCAREEGL